MANANPRSDKRSLLSIDLALQGGGSHGAFTWGVLDRILDVPWIKIEAISGTSAGAMNAAILAHGLVNGGPQAAQQALHEFWSRVAQAAAFSPFQRTCMDHILGRWTLDFSPAYIVSDLMARLVSPYTLGGWNPLVEILNDIVDLSALKRAPVKIFITATNVRTGRGRVFRNDEISADVLLASACLPSMYQAVEIDGEFYWDGGYAGNPTITPLVRESDAQDVVLVQINPVERADVPRTARDIVNRVNEVSFNATLLKELRMIALLRRVADPGNSEGRRWAEMRMHRISSDMMPGLGASSKLNAEWAFLEMLRDEGRRVTSEFGARHRDDIGIRSTYNVEDLLEGV